MKKQERCKPLTEETARTIAFAALDDGIRGMLALKNDRRRWQPTWARGSTPSLATSKRPRRHGHLLSRGDIEIPGRRPALPRRSLGRAAGACTTPPPQSRA